MTLAHEMPPRAAMLPRHQDPIVAIATAPGRGAVGIVRVSGRGLDAFVQALGGIFEHSPWVAEAVVAQRPFATPRLLHLAMCEAVQQAPLARQLALVCAHPELAGKAAIRGELTLDSTREQQGAGLDQCSAEEYAELHAWNARYRERFGFPFILAVRGHTRTSILSALRARTQHATVTEFAECLRQIERIAELRLAGLLG